MKNSFEQPYKVHCFCLVYTLFYSNDSLAYIFFVPVPFCFPFRFPFRVLVTPEIIVTSISGPWSKIELYTSVLPANYGYIDKYIC